MEVNGWSVEWREDRRWRPVRCRLALQCAGVLTRGAASFTRDGKYVLVEGGSPPCCRACATAYVVREGLKGSVIIRQLAGKLSS